MNSWDFSASPFKWWSPDPSFRDWKIGRSGEVRGLWILARYKGRKYHYAYTKENRPYLCPCAISFSLNVGIGMRNIRQPTRRNSEVLTRSRGFRKRFLNSK